MNPKVSVLMSVYNGTQYLREAMDSILAQTFADFEFLIVDDCSTDNSPAILKEYADKDSRVRVITNEFNLGLTKNLNKMISESRGEYLARFDCDDVSLPDRFKDQVAYLNEHAQCGMVSLWADVIDGQGQYVRTIKYPTTNSELQKALIRYNPFFHPGLMMRKSAVLDVGPYDATWRFAQDYELYFRIAKKYELGNVPRVLLKYRETGGSITGSKNKQQIGFVIKAKKKAISEGQYPKWNYVYLGKQYVSQMLPVPLKRFIKKILAR